MDDAVAIPLKFGAHFARCVRVVAPSCIFGQKRIRRERLLLPLQKQFAQILHVFPLSLFSSP